MKFYSWLLFFTGVVLWFLPQLRRSLFPNRKPLIQWEQIIWGYRPGILPRFFSLVCFILGYVFLTTDMRPTITLSESEFETTLRRGKLIYTLVAAMFLAVPYVAVRVTNLKQLRQRVITYELSLSRSKRILAFAFSVLGLLIGCLAWMYSRHVFSDIQGAYDLLSGRR